MNLHYGCGLEAAADWLNYDASPTLRLQRLPVVGVVLSRFLSPRFPKPIQYGDIVRGISIPSESCDAIYCSHVLEHLSLEDLRVALRNTFTYLKAEGTFRLVLPDFEQQVAAYQSNPDAMAISNFMGYTFLGRKARPRGFVMFLKEYWGNDHHLWAWDYKGLAHELQEAGFRGLRRCACGDARNPIFSKVENPERFKGALAIECTK